MTRATFFAVAAAAVLSVPAVAHAQTESAEPIPSAAESARRGIPTGDTDILLYALGGVGLLLVGGGLMRLASRRAARGSVPPPPPQRASEPTASKKAARGSAQQTSDDSLPPRLPTPDAAAPGGSSAVARLQQDVRAWSERARDVGNA